MVILGIGDGLDAGAALVVDDRVVAVEAQARLDGVPGSRAFPWRAADAVLQEAGLRERDVDVVAVAGRFTPPLFLRRHPGLRKVARDAFSPAVDATVLVQAMLKQSGWGAMEADRAQEWLQQRFVARGFRPQRVVLVDIHKALANAAYRTQPDDRVAVVTLHPMGDGVVCAAHVGVAGQLDRVWEQKGFASLHLHLERCATAMGFAPVLEPDRMWATAAEGIPDERLLDHLREHLRADGPRLRGRGRAVGAGRSDAVYQALAASDRATAAASVLHNLTGVVRTLVRHHLNELGCDVLAVAGALWDNPRLVADVAAIPEVTRLWTPPELGWSILPLGAAVSVGGLSCAPLPAALGRQFAPRQLKRCLDAAALDDDRGGDVIGVAADLVAQGGIVGRFSGPGGFGREASGTRSVLVRADDAAAIERARWRLGQPEHREPLAIVAPGAPGLDDTALASLVGPIRTGNAAPRLSQALASLVPGAITADGRARLFVADPAEDPDLVGLLRETQARCGCGALAALPLARGHGPAVGVPADAVRLHREVGLDGLLLGPFLAHRP